MNFKRDQRSTRKDGESKKDTFRCIHCEELFKVKKERPTCAFDGVMRQYHMSHGGCGTMKRLKTAMRVLGDRTLKDEERENKATAWHYECPDNVVVQCVWYKKYDGGHMTLATEGYGPLTLDRAYKIIAQAETQMESTAMGLTDEELFAVKDSMGIEADEVEWGEDDE